MLKVSPAREPVWIELAPGARIQMKPWSTVMLGTGQNNAAQVIAAGHTQDVASVAFTIAAARAGALAWEGVGDDAGEPLAMTPDNVQALLEQSPEAYRAVDLGWVIPGLQKEAEKNVSAP